MLRVQISNEQIGSLVLDQSEYGLDDPKGLEKLDQTVKRSDENDGIVYEITLALDWAKKARQFIQSCYTAKSIQAEIIVNLYEYNPNAGAWELYYTGKLDATKYKIGETLVTLPIQQIGFQRAVLNLMGNDLDLETIISQNGSAIPATPTIDLLYHAKKILKGFDASPEDSNEFLQVDAMTMEFDDDGDDIYRDKIVIGQIDNGTQRQKDLKDCFTMPYSFLPISGDKDSLETVADFLAGHLTPRNEVYRATEGGTLKEIDIKLRLKHKVTATNTGGDVDIGGDGILGNVLWEAWVEHRHEDNSVVSVTQVGTAWTSPGLGGDSRETDYETKLYNALGITVLEGDKFYVYFTARIYGTYEEPAETFAGHGFVHHSFRVTADKDNTYMKFTVETEFPASTHKTIMIYEALNKTVQYYTNQTDCFKSDFFGRVDTDPAYLQDGAGSLMGITNGRILRDLPNKSIYTNLEDALKSLNPAWCLGMGFELIDGLPKLVIEGKEHFYDKDQLILELGNVTGLEMEVAMKYYYSMVELGYPKLDAGQINGIDEPNTSRKWNSPFTEAKLKLILKSLWKTSSYEIEAQRRLQGQTQDSRNDESIFMIMLRRAIGGFETARDQDYTIVNNLYDAPSTYNLDLSPARCAQRWLKVLAAPLWAVTDKLYAYASGEANVEMETQRTGETGLLSEKGPINCTSIAPIWLPEIYLFKYPVTRDEFKLIRQYPYGYIKFRDTLDNILEGYMLEVGRKPNEKLADFKLLKVYRAPQ